MFDFFRNFIFNNINSNKKIDGVLYVADNRLKNEIKMLLKRIGFGNINFGLILLRLGLEDDKVIYLKELSNEYDLSFSYGYESDVFNSDRIDFLVNGSSDNYENDGCYVILSGDGYKKRYRCCYDLYDRDGIKIDKQDDMIIKNMYSCQYIRMVERYGFWIKVLNNSGYEILLNCTGRFDGNIDNEIELEEYLTNLEFPVSSVDVYKKVCEISIGNESNFSKFDIDILKDGNILSSISYDKEDLFSIFTPKRIYEVKNMDNQVSYCRYLPDNWNIRNYNNLSKDVVKIELKNGMNKIIIEVKLGNLQLNNMFELDNEVGLRDYLVGLEFPILIDELYKKICEISIGDVSRYESIKLDCYYNGINTDSLYINYGKFKFYNMVRDDREIILDDSGFFVYKKNGEIMFTYSDIGVNNDLICEVGINKFTQNVVDEISDKKVKSRIRVRDSK